MSVHRRKLRSGKSNWVVRWRDPSSRERTFRTKADAEAFEREIRRQVAEGTYLDPRAKDVTFREWYQAWWPTIEHSKRARNTIVNYESIGRLHVLPYLGNRKLRDCKGLVIERWIASLFEKGLSGSGIHKARVIAKMVFESAVKSNVIASNPLDGLKLRLPPSKPKTPLTAGEVESISDAIDPHYRTLVLVLAWGGLRPGEAAALQRKHLDDLGRLTIEGSMTEVQGHLEEGDTKTHKTRLVTLAPSVLAELKSHINEKGIEGPDDYLFTTPKGSPLRGSNFRNGPLKKSIVAAGVTKKVTPYIFRHTAASLLAKAGVPASTAAAMLGHDPAVFLRTYAHLYPEDLGVAAQALEGIRTASNASTSDRPASEAPAS